MREIRTDDEALVAIGRAVTQWVSTSAGVLTQASAAAAGAEQHAQGVARRCRSRVAALEAALTALPEDTDVRSRERELAAARRSQRTADEAARRLRGAVDEITAICRAHARTAQGRADAARADLARRGGDLRSYRASGGFGSSSPGRTASPTGGSNWMVRSGMTDIDIATADYSDNPIVGNFTRTNDVSRADYRWAVQTWVEVVRPGLDRGMDREDFATRDAKRGAPPLRRTAAVYDLFLGDDSIRLSRYPDGALKVNSGRHRIEIARELGITHLPGKVFG